MKLSVILIAIALLFAGCQSKESRIKVAATPVPHAEILQQIKPDMKKEGYELKIIEIEDYNLPNRLLYEEKVDANFFQHIPFLEMQNLEFGYNLEVLAKIHIEPLGIYSKKIRNLPELSEGATIAIPSDPTNEARALQLLSDKGLLKLKSEAVLLTPLDITENPKKVKIREVDASLLPRTLSDVDIAVIPANFALQTGMNPGKDALALESPDSPYANVLVIRGGEERREELQLLKKYLISEKVRNFILKKYSNTLIPAF